MKVFISYTKDGEKHAADIERDLKAQNIGIWIDKKSLKPGRLWLQEIDDALYNVDYVLGVVTKNYLTSKGGTEAYAEISKGLNDKDIKFIPLFFIPPQDVKSRIIPSIKGFDFSNEYKTGLYNLLEYLKNENKDDPKELLTQIESPDSTNPFRRVRAEFFQNDYKLLASAFAEPEKEKYDNLREAKPIIIFGGRGSGKTMILKSLTPEVMISRLKVDTFQKAKECGMDFWGIYFRLKKGSLLLYECHPIIEIGFQKTGLSKNYELYKILTDKLKNNILDNEPVLTAGVNAAWTISLNEINLKILKTTLQTLNKLKHKGIFNIDRSTEETVAKQIQKILDPSMSNDVRSFDDLIELGDKELRKIERYLQDITLPYSTPNPNWCKTGVDFLDEIFEILIKVMDDLKNTNIYLLFDEFENLRPFQQTIINQWIKVARNFTVKVASKFKGMYTNITQEGQALQDGQDYWSWKLDYNLFDEKEKAVFQHLLLRVCNNLLKIENYREQDLLKILAAPTELELPRGIIDNEIKEIRISSGLKFMPEKLPEYRNKLELAAIFRILRKKEKVQGRKVRKKLYAGFDAYTYLSSGIIRIFLNLIGMAFYKAEGDGIDVKSGNKIPIEHQSWAAYTVSRAWLEKIPINLEEHGEKMYQFIVDIGDIFRERLLNHSSEPETLTVSITNPNNLESSNLLNSILSHSVRESILYEREETSSMRPKQSTRPKSKEYVLNRVYSPILEISYRPRWPRGSKFTTSELADLLNPYKRDMTKRKLQHRVKKERTIENAGPLFDYFEEENEKDN